jgi:hypothetical protein
MMIENAEGSVPENGVMIPGTRTTLDAIFSGVAADSQPNTATVLPVRVISHAGIPRWVLPEDTRRAVTVLKSWKPYSAKSRLKWGAVLASCRLNALVAMPGIARENLSCDLSYWGGRVPEFSSSWTIVAYIGNPSPTRKALLFFIDEDAQIRAVVKVPIYPAAKAAILNEANVLANLRNRLPLPQILFSDARKGIAGQSWMEGANIRRAFRAQHLDLLTCLASERMHIRLGDRREQLQQRISSLPFTDFSLLNRALSLLDLKEELRTCVEHGDFTTWNMRRLKNGQLTLIDWEWAVEAGFPWQDVCRYFYLQDYLFHESADVWKVLMSTPLLAEYRRRFDLSPEAVRGLTIYYLLRFLCDEHEEGDRDKVEYAMAKIREVLNLG